MTDEDVTAAKLRGYTCLIKFHDGEELLVKIRDIGTDDAFFEDVETFINSKKDGIYFPAPDIAIDRASIKYVKML